jgi:hypothetical protein
MGDVWNAGCCGDVEERARKIEQEEEEIAAGHLREVLPKFTRDVGSDRPRLLLKLRFPSLFPQEQVE